MTEIIKPSQLLMSELGKRVAQKSGPPHWETPGVQVANIPDLNKLEPPSDAPTKKE